MQHKYRSTESSNVIIKEMCASGAAAASANNFLVQVDMTNFLHIQHTTGHTSSHIPLYNLRLAHKCASGGSRERENFLGALLNVTHDCRMW